MVAQDTAEVLEEAKDVVEDTVALVESRVSWLTQNPKLAACGAGSLGIVVGALLGVAFVKKRMETKYQKIADEQVEDVKNHYALRYKDSEAANLSALASQYPDEEPVIDPVELKKTKVILEREGYTAYDKVVPTTDEGVVAEEKLTVVREEVVETTKVEKNIFSGPEDEWDQEEEEKRREERPNDPYIITVEEFNENESDFNQITLTYYDGDQVLADDKDQPINDEEKITGSSNLLKFGHGSKDKNVVYICNERLGALFEVVRSDGEFAKEVLGFRHSDRPQQHRFRSRD